MEEIPVSSEKQTITVNVVNVQFPSTTFTAALESVEGNVDAEVELSKTMRGVKPVDWVKIKGSWSNLHDIPITKVANWGTIDASLET